MMMCTDGMAGQKHCCLQPLVHVILENTTCQHSTDPAREKQLESCCLQTQLHLPKFHIAQLEFKDRPHFEFLKVILKLQLS